MFSLFIVLLIFSSSLPVKCLFLNDEPYMDPLIDLDHDELKYYQFMISLDKCAGSCNVLSPKIYVPKETKDKNIKASNMTTNKNKAEAMTQHISCESKCKFNSTIYNLNQKWNNKTCQCKCKNYCTSKKDYSWNPNTCISVNSKYLKSITDTSVTECNEIIIAMDNILTKRTIATNVKSTASIKFHNIEVRDCCILHTVLLAIMLLLTICYHYAKQKGKI